MRILVTNDDGIASPGLWALARELAKVGEVLVAAPNRDMSGSAAAMMLRRPARVRACKPPRDARHLAAYAVSAPPASCALLALRGLIAPGPIDLVVSGINAGPNLGRDALLSGTVGAAFVAALEGVPAVAVSLTRGETWHWQTPAFVAARLAQRLHEAAPRGGLVLNVNSPNLPLAALAGVRIARPSRDCCLSRLLVEADPQRPRTFALTTERQVPRSVDEGSDEWAVANGYISITPLLPEVAVDRADARLAEWVADLLTLGDLVEV